MATEQRAYRVVGKEDGFEIRHYAPANLASVEVAGGYSAMRGEGFSELAGYIFGGNSEDRKIAMTAPVIMDMEQDKPGGTMSFVMPRSFSMEERPAPRSKRIFFRHEEPFFAAAVRFGGYASSRDLEEHKARLFRVLERRGLKHSGHAEFFFYDPPYKVLGRRNEVIVRLVDYQPEESRA